MIPAGQRVLPSAAQLRTQWLGRRTSPIKVVFECLWTINQVFTVPFTIVHLKQAELSLQITQMHII